MANCSKCGAELIGARKFCAACGAPAESQPGPRSNAAAMAPAPAPADPFAETAMKSGRAGSAYGPPPVPMQPKMQQPPVLPPVQPPAYAPAPAPSSHASPLASSNVPYAMASAYGPPPQQAQPQPPPYAHYGPSPLPVFDPGSRVLVQWADGNRYPAMVQQAANGQCLVMFPNGQQQWVEMRYLTAGM